MFISPAYAQAAGGAGAGGGLEALLPLVLIFVVFYFLLIRPQQKRAKEHKETVNNLRRGDKVVTNGGIIGTVSKVVDDNDVMIEVAEGVKVRVRKIMIAELLSKPQPANDAGKPEGDGGGDGGTVDKGEGGAASKLKGLLGGKK